VFNATTALVPAEQTTTQVRITMLIKHLVGHHHRSIWRLWKLCKSTPLKRHHVYCVTLLESG
jgi:hypothetical protein